MEEVKLMTRLHKTRVIIIKYLFVCFRMVGSCCTENPCGCEGDGLKLFVLIGYRYGLIDYMLWGKVFFRVLFCFNQLPYILIDYKGLRGSFSSIFNRLYLCFNRLHLCFNRLLISDFGFG